MKIKTISAQDAALNNMPPSRCIITSTNRDVSIAPDRVEFGYMPNGDLVICVFDTNQREGAMGFFSPADADELIEALTAMRPK